MPEKKASTIFVAKEADFTDTERWPELIQWMIDMAMAFSNAFHYYLKPKK